MTDVEILESTYEHTCNIIREVEVINEDTGVNEKVETVIAEGIKCALSRKESSAEVLNGDIGSIVCTHKLFINPRVDIKLGDRLEVINEIGEKGFYLASEPFYYKTHREVPVTSRERS